MSTTGLASSKGRSFDQRSVALQNTAVPIYLFRGSFRACETSGASGFNIFRHGTVRTAELEALRRLTRVSLFLKGLQWQACVSRDHCDACVGSEAGHGQTDRDQTAKRIIFHHTAGHQPGSRTREMSHAQRQSGCARSIRRSTWAAGLQRQRSQLSRLHERAHPCRPPPLVHGNQGGSHGRFRSRSGQRRSSPASNTSISTSAHDTKQLEASARLHAWIMSRCGIPVSEVFGHGEVALREWDCVPRRAQSRHRQGEGAREADPGGRGAQSGDRCSEVLRSPPSTNPLQEGSSALAVSESRIENSLHGRSDMRLHAETTAASGFVPRRDQAVAWAMAQSGSNVAGWRRGVSGSAR